MPYVVTPPKFTTSFRIFTTSNCNYLSNLSSSPTNLAKMDASQLPDFQSLPPVKDMPHGCAWGLFDQEGKRDNLGTLPGLTAAAAILRARRTPC